MISRLFHAIGLLGLFPTLMLAFLGNKGGAIFCMVLVFILHGLGIYTDNDSCEELRRG